MNKITFFKIIIKIIILVIMMSTFMVNLTTAYTPWDKYANYLPSSPPIIKRHFRSMWVTTVLNSDWPSVNATLIKDVNNRISTTKNELITILDKAVELNMNAIILQVSPRGDAFYKSNIIPWSTYITGTLGQDPGFDPLEFAVEEAHKRNLELHAWFNPYMISQSTSNNVKLALNIDKSVYKEHPDWVKTSSDRFVVDPGIPDVRQWVENRVMEVVKNYDIDGIHFDDYFYSESTFGELDDKKTYEKYNNGKFSDIKDFRRNNTYLLVKEVSKKIKREKPWVKFGISPAAIWANKSHIHPDGSNTSGYESYSQSFADTKKWVQEEIIDYIIPQVYFSFSNPKASYGEIASWWSEICNGHNVHLYIGQALYKVNSDRDIYFKGNNAVDEFTKQMTFNICRPGISGSTLFRYGHIIDPPKVDVINKIKSNIWNTKSLTPVMPWKKGYIPSIPTDGNLTLDNNAIKISWRDNDPNTAYFAIYKFPIGSEANIFADSSAFNLLATIRKTDSNYYEYIDNAVEDKAKFYYVVSSLDRLHNESQGITIKNSLSKYFSDIDSRYSWAYKAIDALSERKIMNGCSPSNFCPEKKIIRGDFTLTLFRIFKTDTDFSDDFSDNFIDVPQESYYYNAISMFKKLDIVKGYNGYFYPTKNITREECISIVYRTLLKMNINLDDSPNLKFVKFDDESDISYYAKKPILALANAGVIQGFNGKINPKSPITRAEIAVIVENIINKYKLLNTFN